MGVRCIPKGGLAVWGGMHPAAAIRTSARTFLRYPWRAVGAVLLVFASNRRYTGRDPTMAARRIVRRQIPPKR